jgi:hypothetical protein
VTHYGDQETGLAFGKPVRDGKARHHNYSVITTPTG